MNRKAMLKAASGVPGQSPTGAPPLARVPDFVGAAAVQTDQGVSRFGQPSAQPALLLLMTDPADLVARALEILTEENDAWQARRVLTRPPRTIR